MVGKHQTGLCEGCQEEEESVEHVVLRCREYGAQREEMRIKLRELGVQEITVNRLLSMGNRERTKILLDFLKNFGIFHRV